MPDHIHFALRVPAKHSPAQQPLSTGPFGWQDGHGVFSLSRSHLGRVIAHIEHQKARHSTRTLWLEWEETDEEAEASTPLSSSARTPAQMGRSSPQ